MHLIPSFAHGRTDEYLGPSFVRAETAHNAPALSHTTRTDKADNRPCSDTALPPDLSPDSPISVFHSAIATFYAPSDLSGLRGMHTECI